MSNEEQFDGRVKRLFQAESVAPPAELEERLFSQLNPSPWPKRLGIGAVIVAVSFAGWYGSVSELDKSEPLPLLESVSKAQPEVELSAIPVELNAAADVPVLPEKRIDGEAEDETVSAQADEHPSNQKAPLESTKPLEHVQMDPLNRVPVTEIPGEDPDASTLQEGRKEWVLPAVVKLKD